MDGEVRIDRASPGDLAMASLGSRRMPEQFGAVLVLDDTGFDLSVAETLLADRVRAIPRFRQTLVSVPRWQGRPIWVEDTDFDPTRHIRHRTCPRPGDEDALLDLAAELVCQPLAADRPLWSATFVTGLSAGKVGLVIVVDHVVSDGIGGLAALGSLVDGAPPISPEPLPHRRPTPSELRAEAVRSWLRTLKQSGGAIRGLAASLRSAHRVRPARAADCTLLAVTGPKRRFAVVRGDLAAIHTETHRRGATVNDAVLAAIGGALRTLLAHRGEHIDEFVVSEPVSVRATATAGALGNRVNEMLVAVPAAGAARLGEIARRTRAARAASAVGVGSFAWLSAVIRIAARTGLLRHYLNRQHMIHTVVSNVRGPANQLCFAGQGIADIVPISVAENWNVTVTFVAFSYAGRLTITVTADPEHVPDLDVLVRALRSEVQLLEGTTPDDARH
ncbi:wax ester/triacylglycerol synthase domain-containing protein [Smaragdicoccus niigatensis]|uniref:wax ester/triacylglycerol synthase domain-containing protein n=1 Tax=Smaragdicoccus niigatensis TaxID=359359 RepID=UPI0003730F33|nr:wax ester/triacylglycerol synthase domain-containing protein [Smaragdicoccus niigatensis]